MQDPGTDLQSPLETVADPQLSEEAIDCIRRLAQGLGDPQHLVEALARVAARTPKTPDASPPPAAVLQCLGAAAAALPAYPPAVSSLPQLFFGS